MRIVCWVKGHRMIRTIVGVEPDSRLGMLKVIQSHYQCQRCSFNFLRPAHVPMLRKQAEHPAPTEQDIIKEQS